MADFVYLSDTDDSAVDELISQIQDLSVLEEVSKINTSFTDSLLPPHLETRFQKLKSFPLSNNSSLHGNTVSDSQTEIFSPNKQNPDDKFGPDDVSVEEEENPDGEKDLIKEKKSNLTSGSFGSSNSSMDSPSPPHRSGCFWCSKKKKKKVPKKKKNEKWNIDWVDMDDALSSFSIKEREKILSKAMKEEEKINREAEKIVKWAKQASNRLSFHAIEDEFSDDDKPKF